MTSYPDKAGFEALLGERFALGNGGDTVQLSLAEVSQMGQGMREGGAFSLVFTGPEGVAIPQGTHELSHARAGALSLFLVPIGPFGEGMGYEAVFT